MKMFVRAAMATFAATLLVAGCQASGNVSVNPGTGMASPTPGPAAAMAFNTQFKALAGSGTGTGSVSLSGDMKSLTVSATASGLTGAPTMAHIHRADTPGGSGGVVKDLQLSGNTASATWSVTDANQPLTMALIDDLKAGRLYIAFHTQANPGGELRGDITVR